MAKTPDAQLRAIRKYDTEKRQGVAITFRLSPKEIAKLDKVRGDFSRSGFAAELVRGAIEKGPSK
jgi:hypothetical protein